VAQQRQDRRGQVQAVTTGGHASDEPLKQSRALSLLGLLQVQAQLHFLKQLDVVMLTPDLMNQALDLHQHHKLAFYDAMIVSAAHASHCTTLYSEDFNAGEVLRGVKLVNPFAELT
jgi:predicted nucleic acid-binding protein